MNRWLVFLLPACGSLACGGGGSDAAADDEETSESAGDTGGSDDGEEPAGLPPIDPTICENLSFDNTIDEVVCDEIQGRGVDPLFADEIEICRRLYVDLLGRLPTQSDFANDCEGRTTETIVDDFMDRDEYVAMGRRQWADIFQMTSEVAYYEYIEELDEVVAELYRGDIKLPQFAEKTVTNPGFTMRFDGQDRVGFSFIAFLGRDAQPHERDGLEPLWHMWESRYEDVHPDYFFGYSRAVVNTIRCMNSAEADCHSDLWGPHSVVIPPALPDDYDYNGPNIIRIEDLSSDQWDQLRLPGRLIAQQPTFYETAADRAFMRYLGYEAGIELPLARQVLVDMLESNGGGIRALEREILTSQLYTMAMEFPDPDDTPVEESSPDFWHGPAKQVTAEAWLASLGAFAGFDPGSCDHRFPVVQGATPNPGDNYMLAKYHPNAYPKDEDWPADSNRPDYTFREAAALLGGCPDQQGQLRFTGTGVMIAIAQDAVGQFTCLAAATEAVDPPIMPADVLSSDKSVETLTGIADHIYKATTLRDPSQEVSAAIATSVSGCRDDAECDALRFSFHTCTAMLKSAPVVFY